MIDESTARTLRRLSDLHAVYRMFDAQGALLYVGMTAQIGRRIEQHGEKRWFPQVATISVEWYPHMAAARVAEKEAIEWEWPRHNLAGVKRRSPRRPATPPVVPPRPRHPAPRPAPPPPAPAAVAAVPASPALPPETLPASDCATLKEMCQAASSRAPSPQPSATRRATRTTLGRVAVAATRICMASPRSGRTN